MSFQDQSQQYLEEGYGLGRGYASSLRLNVQHHLLQKLIGYNIHPEVRTKGGLPRTPKIADVGTGTAQWLIDVADEVPSAQLDGFDISSDQFPCKAWLPHQITLDKLDITKPVPSSLQGKYDLVHVQLFLCVVKKDGPDAILKELSKMLKPGGFLQWVEYDPASFKVVSPDPTLKQSSSEKHVEIIRGPNGVVTRWPSELSKHFQAVGLELVASDSYPLRTELYAPFMQCHLGAAEEVSFTAMKNDAPNSQGPLFRELLRDTYRECQSGVTMAESPVVVVGRKPTLY
ncbi:MAG: hypothetical protein Q9191_005563 [Dirinaria sp. TL-2023a]